MAIERTIHLALPEHAYDIRVRAGLFSDAGSHIRKLAADAQKAIVVRDVNVPDAALARLRTSLAAAAFEITVIDYPASEETKSWEWVGRLFEPLLRARIDRKTPIIALGGGVTGDVAGFIAATALRGVPFIQCPTTLLAMVDASVGGKTGVNHAVGKNLIGAFHQPIAVLIDTEVLTSLAPRELRGGLAECIKHNLIRDATGFAALEKEIDRVLAVDLEYLSDLVAHNVAIKARVVEADPFERGERAHLNFGHTFGHAIESVSHYRYSHGESVALGMVAATYLSVRFGLLTEPEERRIRHVIAAAGLPTDGLALDRDEVVAAMAFDKKAAGGKIRFVLLNGIGKAVIREDVAAEWVLEAVARLE